MRDYDGNFAPGSMLFFSLQGSLDESYAAAMRVSNHIAAHALSVTLAVSLGQIKTLIEHPASMTHSAISPEVQMQGGILPGGLRLSVGLEDPRDIIADLERALALAKAPA
jgi:cystathionine beta-lyase/cystathionine gamma-synthase